MKRPSYEIISIEHLNAIVKEICEAYEEIQIAYLYGSYSQGLNNKHSDIDIGVVLKDPKSNGPLFFARIGHEIEKKLHYKVNVDLRILNNANPRFLYQVLKNKHLLYYKNETFKDEYELKVLNQYLDIKPLLDEFDENYIKKVLENEN